MHNNLIEKRFHSLLVECMVTYRDYPARDIGVRDQDQELISKITKPLREVSVILFTNRSPDTRLQIVDGCRLQLVTRDPSS